MSWDKLIAKSKLRTAAWAVLVGGLFTAAVYSEEIKGAFKSYVNEHFSLTGPKATAQPESRPYSETQPSEERVPFSTSP